MRNLFTFTCIIAGLTVNSFAQTLPPINSGFLPNDTDAVCSTPWYNNIDFDSAGYLVGDTVNDFTLFEPNGNSYTLSNALAQGKPVLFVTGSLTCPYFRSQLTDINTVASAYSSYINTVVVYVIEAHPTDTSPYSGSVNVTSQNINQGITFPQPTTYLERKNLVDTLLQYYSVDCPIIIDGPCNEWWHTYGPAPQNAYLIDTNGTVLMKHGWFHQYPNNIYCDLDSILGVNLSYCVPTTANGLFTLNTIAPAAWGTPGQSIYAFADIVNNSTDDAFVEVVKIIENYNPGWNSSFCMGICYQAAVDSTTILLLAGDTMHFSLDFFTSPTPDSSRVLVGFRNAHIPGNNDQQWFYGYTSPVGVTESNAATSFKICPNPCGDVLEINTTSSNGEPSEYIIYDSQGRAQKTEVIESSGTQSTIDVSNLAPGIYLVERNTDSQRSVIRFVKL